MKTSGKSSGIVGSRREPSLTTSPRALRSRAGEVVGWHGGWSIICRLAGTGRCRGVMMNELTVPLEE